MYWSLGASKIWLNRMAFFLSGCDLGKVNAVQYTTFSIIAVILLRPRGNTDEPTGSWKDILKQIFAIMISTENIKCKGWVQALNTNNSREHTRPQTWGLEWALDLHESKLYKSLLSFKCRKIV